MDVITSMIYETSFRSAVRTEVERYCKGLCNCYLDKENDCFRISLIDPHDRVWAYDEYDLTNKLYKGVSSKKIAHNFIRAYEKKIFREFFQ